MKILFIYFAIFMVLFFTTKQEITISLPHDECGYSPREKMKLLANQLGLNFIFQVFFPNPTNIELRFHWGTEFINNSSIFS